MCIIVLSVNALHDLSREPNRLHVCHLRHLACMASAKATLMVSAPMDCSRLMMAFPHSRSASAKLQHAHTSGSVSRCLDVAEELPRALHVCTCCTAT